MIRLGKLSCQVGNLFYILQRAETGRDLQRRGRQTERERSGRDAVFSVFERLEMDFSSGDLETLWVPR